MHTIQSLPNPRFCSVYGPVKSWRYGNSLGIDAIGLVSTCSFNCVYCQLGNIEQHTSQRQIFVPTAQILEDLQAIATWENIDVVTLSGSGEPTLALNLAEILAAIKELTQRPSIVLTNSTLLGDRTVRSALKLADIVAVKLDAISSDQLRRVNQPVATIDLPDIVAGIEQFRQEYQGHMAIQTMVLSPWKADILENYIQLLQHLKPDEIQLNTPSRPRVLVRQLDARGNNVTAESSSNVFQNLRCVSTNVLSQLAQQIYASTHIPVRCPPILH
ncbi:radical SAM protein [Nostoc sp. FACHB-152]|uniref:radical SAM protein n=1 Tax=unclassified Nostoc TaxID=2593658 RepID=UPI0016870BE6|nr:MULTISPECIES: radical SAM protein [unclassified Nostoc]MBD2452296.1 radical SAM protein [Nostoc sp. FACHB-152]MBD2466286.1 radical SAM protein [Nostoc sp. FACHB-145]